MTVRDFIHFLKSFEDDPHIRIKVSRDHIHIAVIIFGHMDPNDFPECFARFLEKENPERFGPEMLHDEYGNPSEVTSFVFDDDGSLDDERGFPIKRCQW